MSHAVKTKAYTKISGFFLTNLGKDIVQGGYSRCIVLLCVRGAFNLCRMVQLLPTKPKLVDNQDHQHIFSRKNCPLLRGVRAFM